MDKPTNTCSKPVDTGVVTINFKSEEAKKSWQKVKEKKKEIASRYKIDVSKLNIYITV